MSGTNTIFREYYPDKALNELLSFSIYDREQGGFIRTAKRRGRGQSKKIGELIGTPSKDGYLIVRLLGFPFAISHLVWLAEYGEWSPEDLDHKDGVVTNNHISNLRPASQLINGKNKRMCSDNTTGYTGVCFDISRDAYMAYVCVAGKQIHCGRHPTAEEAYAARQAMIAAHPEWGFTARHGL